jgi:photosystem II stability/assembly factor-like uncharacterized protein
MSYFILLTFTAILVSSSIGYAQSLNWKEIGNITPQYFRDFVATPRAMLFVNDSNDVFRSEDTGKTWQHSLRMPVRCEHRNSSAQGNRLFMSFGYEGYRFGDTSDLGEGVYRSDDNGRAWQRVLKVSVSRVVASESMIVAVRRTNFLYSTNAGISWQNLNYNPFDLNQPSFAPLGYNALLGNTFFICSTLGLVRIDFDATKPARIDTLLKEYSISDIVSLKSTIVVRAEKKPNPSNKDFAGTYIATSTDKGNSWKIFPFRIHPDIDSQEYWRSDSTLYAPTKFYSNNGHLGISTPASGSDFVSEDTGRTWKYYQPIRQPLRDNFALSNSKIIYAENGITFLFHLGGLSLMRIDAKGCEASVTTGNDIRKVALWYLDSCQSGNYLNQSFSTKPNERILSLLFKSDTLYANTAHGIFRSANNGIHWERIGFMNNGFSDFSNYFYSRSVVLHKSHFFGLSRGLFCENQVPTFRQYECFDGYRLMRLPEGGSFWKTIITYPFNTFDSIYAIGSLGDNLVAAKSDTVYYSSNSGDSWQKSGVISHVTVFADIGTRLLAGTEQNGIYISADSGKTWFSSRENLQGKVKTITSRSNVVFALTDAGIWRSPNNGTSWFPVNEGLSDTIKSITTTKDFVVALDSKGNVFLSSNDGEQWQKTSQRLDALEIFYHRDYLFAYANVVKRWSGVFGLYPYEENSQFFQSKIPQLETTPQTNVILGIGPNPASTSTQFTFDVESPSSVNLTVYDILGQTTAVLANSDFSAGRHYITWEVNRVPSGTYMYRLSIGSRITTGRVIVMR